MATYVRFQSPEVSDRGIRVGVFGLVNILGKRGRLSGNDEQWRRERNRWLDEAYTDPSTVDPTVYDREVNPGAVAWFRSDAATHLIEATLEHCALLDSYGVAWQRVESDDPGRIVYEDQHQVVVVPRRPVPAPDGGQQPDERAATPDG